ncbi:negative elongation factor E isoform X2 [Tachypleus tridentatus]
MVYLHFPSQFTEEEEMLQKKYQKLKRKKKALLQLKTPKQEPPAVQNPVKCTPEVKKDAKEVAKKLLKSGAIQAIKVENKERQGFKRSKASERKRSTSIHYQSFGSSSGLEEENTDRMKGVSNNSRPAMKSLFESFVSSREIEEHENKEERDHERDRDGRNERPRQGNTIYVNGFNVTEEILRNGFAPFGNIMNISMELDKNCGFVTFEKMESADKAINEMNGKMVSGVKLRVSLARRQPPVPVSCDGSSASWTTLDYDKAFMSNCPKHEIASCKSASFSQKGSHQDKRELVTYDDDIF